jgi:hypothetical protein
MRAPRCVVTFLIIANMMNNTNRPCHPTSASPALRFTNAPVRGPPKTPIYRLGRCETRPQGHTTHCSPPSAAPWPPSYLHQCPRLSPMLRTLPVALAPHPPRWICLMETFASPCIHRVRNWFATSHSQGWTVTNHSTQVTQPSSCSATKA